jgi:Rrf2 family cysteine metabolism transcriptional repressor
MMTISTKGRYSVRILKAMALDPPGSMFTKHGLAEAEGVSPGYVEQLMMMLKTAGLVNSHRGKIGGFTLARAPETITVADILRATEGPIVMAPCLDGEVCERENGCSTRPLWMKAGIMLEDLFSGVTIAELAKNGAAGSVRTAELV